jgi:hypothetical protein
MTKSRTHTQTQTLVYRCPNVTKEKLIELAMEVETCKEAFKMWQEKKTPEDAHKRAEQDVEYQLASKRLSRARWEYDIALDKYLHNS